MIRLDCPGCGASLEIDRGFVGGVCRCYNCGTLMTVPADPEHEPAQAVERPEHPEAPKPTVPATANDPAAEAVAPADPPGANAAASPASAESAQRPRSQRTVGGSSRRTDRVPVAPRQRRMGIRVAVIGGFVLASLAMVGLMIYLVGNVITAAQGPTPRQLVEQTLGYDPEANPLRMDDANVMGLPAEGRSLAVVIDAGPRMRRHYGLIQPIIVANLATLPAEQSVRIMVAAEPQALAIPDLGPSPAGQIDIPAAAAAMAGVIPGGAPSLADALDPVFTDPPEHLVVIIADEPRRELLYEIERKVDAAEVKLDVILIDEASAALGAIATDSGGRLIELPGGQLERWWQASEQP